MKIDLGGKLLRSSSAATLSQVWRMGVTFLTQAILRRLIAPEDWGFWHWAVDFLFIILGQVRDLGLPAQVVRDPSRPYGAFLVVEVMWGAIAGGLIFLASPLLVAISPESSLNGHILVQALILFFFLEGIGKVPQTFFEAEIRIDRVLWPEIVRNLTYAALALSLAWAGYGVLSLLIAHTAGAAVFAAMLWTRAYREIPLHFSPSALWPLLRSSLPLMLMSILLLGVESADYQVMGIRRFDSDTVGIYGGALMLATLVMRALEWPLRRSLYPTFVAVREDARRFFETYRLSTILLMAIHVPFAGMLVANAATVLRIFWGPEYESGARLLQLLALVPLVQPFARCAEDVLLPRHQERLLTFASALNLTALVALGYFLSGALGAVGVAWAKLVPLGALLITWAVFQVNPLAFGRLCLDLLKLYGIGILLYGGAVLAAGENVYLRFALSILAGTGSLLAYLALFGSSFRDFFQEPGGARDAEMS